MLSFAFCAKNFALWTFLIGVNSILNEMKRIDNKRMLVSNESVFSNSECPHARLKLIMQRCSIKEVISYDKLW